MRALVTGGAGFIGSHLVDALLARGDDVAVIDNFEPDYPRAVKERNVAAHRVHPRCRFMQHDIRSGNWGDEPYDTIIHLAGKAGVLPSIQYPVATYDTNVGGTLAVLEHARAARAGKVIFASSSSVYGGTTTFPSSETDPLVPISPYAASKLAGEQLCQLYAHLHGLQIVALRFFTVYGPRQRPDLAIHKFAKAILDDRGVTLYGDGLTTRDYTYIDDIVAGILAAIDYRGTPFEIVNLGSGSPVSLRRMLTGVADALGRAARVTHYPEQVGDPPVTWASIEKARTLFGWEPRVRFDDGVGRFVTWLSGEGAEDAA